MERHRCHVVLEPDDDVSTVNFVDEMLAELATFRDHSHTLRANSSFIDKSCIKVHQEKGTSESPTISTSGRVLSQCA